MTTYEEDIVDVFLNLKGYFTIKNMSFPPEKKKAGGKGRGEIDILAIKPEESGFSFIRAEVSVSLTSRFPFKSAIDRVDIDETFKLVKKFFSKSAENKIKEYTKGKNYDCILISSAFESNSPQKLVDRANELEKKRIWKDRLGLKMRFFKAYRRKESIIVNAQFNDMKKRVKVTSFSNTINSFEEIFIKRKLLPRSFQDPRLRGIQHMIHQNLRNFIIRIIEEIDSTQSARKINRIVLDRFERQFGKLEDDDVIKEVKDIIKVARLSMEDSWRER